MTKLSRKKLDPKDFVLYINNLWSAFTLADSKESIKLLFKDLFTHTEYKMFAKRLEIARRLLRGETYEAISKELKVTAHTIASISNILSEKGEGLRKADKWLSLLEGEHFERQREVAKNLENPFRKRVKDRNKTVLGALLKVGIYSADRAISRKLKQRSAKKVLEI